MPTTSPVQPESTAEPLSGVFGKVYGDIVNDRGLLPSLPDLAIRLRQAMSNPSYDVNSVARVVQTDSAVSAHLIRIANSALYRTVMPIKDVRTAIARLGVPVSRNIVTAYTIRSMFVTRSRYLAAVMRQCWRDSATTSAVASVLAARCPGFSPDRAMLAGLLQNIGTLPLLRAIDNRPKALLDLERLDATLDAYTPRIGVVLLEHWGFDEDIVDTARASGAWQRDAAPAADLADLVTIARLHALVGTPRMHEVPRINEVPAYGKLPLGELTPHESLAILDEARQEIDEVLRSLGV